MGLIRKSTRTDKSVTGSPELQMSGKHMIICGVQQNQNLLPELVIQYTHPDDLNVTLSVVPSTAECNTAK